MLTHPGYEHAAFICTLLNGAEPPKLTDALKEKLRLMFNEIQEPFDKHKPPDRNNFLSYGCAIFIPVNTVGVG